MDLESFKIELNKELDDLSVSEIKDLINQLINNLPSNYYEYVICKIKYFKGEKYYLSNDVLEEYNEVLASFKKIQSGEMCYRCYSYETETYSYYDADMDYVYYPSSELNRVLVDAYRLIKKFILYREYDKVIKLFESIIYSNYTCEEVGNPEYDDSDEVYDTYEGDFNDIKNDLEIDLNYACLCAIYSLIMSNKSDKFDKIWNYIKICNNVNVKDVLNIGVEKINNFDLLYDEWFKYKEKK